MYSPKRSRFGLGRYRSKVYRHKVIAYKAIIVEVKHYVFPNTLKNFLANKKQLKYKKIKNHKPAIDFKPDNVDTNQQLVSAY